MRARNQVKTECWGKTAVLVTICERNGKQKQASRVLSLMSIRYQGVSGVDELGYVCVNKILDVRVNVRK